MRYAGSVWRSTITVMQLATLDLWSEVAIRLYEISPLSLVTIVFTLFLLNFGVINHLVAIMVDRVSNISGEAQEMQEKLLGQAHDTLIRALELDLRQGIGLDGKLSFVAFHKLIQMPSVNQKLQLMGISDEEAAAFFEIMHGERQGGIMVHQRLGCEASSLVLQVRDGLEQGQGEGQESGHVQADLRAFNIRPQACRVIIH